MLEPEVICQTVGPCGLITLNRPKALNALTHAMVKTIAAALEQWADNPAITRVIIESGSERAFCAGGDIRQVHAAGLAGDYTVPLQFWADEYRLNQRIHRYPKPYIALVDGMVMGGGVGISLLGSHVVAGERFSFAMPEVGIGFFPDVGATCFLSHLPHHYGTWLALTASRIDASLACALGLAHSAIASRDIAALKDALLAGEPVDAAIARFGAHQSKPALPDAPWMAHCFAGAEMPDILQRLQQTAAGGEPAAANALAQISGKCPTSLAIALRQMQVGHSMTIEQALQTEYRIVSRICRRPDFAEGVRAVVIDRDNQPKWSPATIDAVRSDDINAVFAPLAGGDLIFPQKAGVPA